MQRILFVCLGNICRSPMAEFIMRNMLAQQGLATRIEVDSAGTSGWHDGEDMHMGTAKILASLGINQPFTERLPLLPPWRRRYRVG